MARKKTNKIQRVIFSMPFLVILTGLVILVAISAINMYRTSRDTQETVERLEEERVELAARQEQLVNTTADLSTPRGLEEEIREKFSVIKEGERVIVLVDAPEAAATSTDENLPWWRDFLNFLWPF